MRRETLLDLFEDFASSHETFVIHDDGYRVRQFTYGQIAQLSHRFAARLIADGFTAEDKVLIWSENRPEWLIAFWGCVLASVVLVPIDYRASGDLLLRVGRIVAAKGILAGTEVTVP